MNREDVITFSTKSHLDVYGLGKDFKKFADTLERFAALVAKHEREACAQVCEELVAHIDPTKERDGWLAAVACTAAIRARGGK